MVNPEIMYELINSYQKTFNEVKGVANNVKSEKDTSEEMSNATKKFEELLSKMEDVESLMIQIRLLFEIREAKVYGFEEEAEIYQEMLSEF